MNFSRKIICILIALNQDIPKRIVKIILDVIIVREITTQLLLIIGKVEIVATMEFREIQLNYHKVIIKVVKLTNKILKPVRKVPVDINTFMSNHKRTTKFKEYEIIVRAISSNKKLFLKVLGTPTIFYTIKEQNIDLAVEQTEFVKGLQLADRGQHSPESKIDILIGSDCYWKVVTGEVKRDSCSEMVAINTMFGWCLSGPF